VFKRHKKMFGVVAAIVVAAATFGAQAFTASNTVPTTDAGSGSNAINLYAVTNVAYTTDGDDITAVKFNLDKVATDVKVRFTNAGPWHDCGGSAATTPFLVTCSTITGEAASAVDELSVTAVQ
jgi:hypothetical protein